MYNGNRIKELLAERSLTNKELLSYLGVECNSSITQLTNGNPTVKKLEKVADFLNVSMNEFFIRDTEFIETKGSTSEINILKDKVELLSQLVEEKQKVINLLEEKIKMMAEDDDRTIEK